MFLELTGKPPFFLFASLSLWPLQMSQGMCIPMPVQVHGYTHPHTLGLQAPAVLYVGDESGCCHLKLCCQNLSSNVDKQKYVKAVVCGCSE